MDEEVMTPETVRRSPLSYEIVEPTKNTNNKQLYENSELADHPVREAAENDPLRLFASEENPPNLAIIHEKPEHRLIIYLKARGLSNKEVAEKTGYTVPWVSQICRQPWFRIRLVNELKEAGLNQVAKLLESSALDSVFTLIDLRDDDDAPKAVRRACADSLLDRFLGRATVHVAHGEERTPSTPEINQVDEELRQIETQLKESKNGTT